MVQITGEEFIKICTSTLRKPEGIRVSEHDPRLIIFEDVEIFGNAHIPTSGFKVSFKNCVLDGISVNTKLGYILNFEGGRIGKLQISARLTGLVITNVAINNIDFSGCEIESDVEITKCNSIDSFIIDKGTFHRKFILKDCQLRYIQIVNGTFKRNTAISNCNISNLLNVEEAVFELDFLVENTTIKKIGITSGYFKFAVAFVNVNCTENITIEGGKFYFPLKIVGGEYKVFDLEGGDFDGLDIWGKGRFSQFSIEGGTFGYIHMRSALMKDVFLNTFVVKNDIDFAGGEYSYIEFNLGFSVRNKFSFTQITNEKLRIHVLSLCQIGASNISISGGNYNTLEFGDDILSRDGSVQISNVKIHQVLFANYNNHGYINFNDVGCSEEMFAPSDSSYISEFAKNPETESVFCILNSSLGKLDFIGCDLTGYKRFIFENSKILDVFIAGTQMPKALTIDEDDNYVKLYAQQRLGYGQLKKIFEARGEQAEAMAYHSLQMDALKKTYTWKNNTSERFTLWLNNISNEHGRNWPRALGFTAVISLILFSFYASALFWGLDNAALDFSDYGRHNFWQLFWHIFDFILPLHKTGFMADSLSGVTLKENAYSAIADFLGRVFISYGIYQLINAFRKHGKSNV